MSQSNESRRRRKIEKRKALLVSSIEKIRPKLHRFTMAGPYSYSKLIQVFGSIKISNDHVSLERQPNYKKQAFAYFNKKRFTIFIDPVYVSKDNRNLCLIETSSPTRRLLSELLAKLPELTVSSVEYTLDI